MSARVTFASLFSGGGLADVGAIAAGLTPLWGVELDADIAACYARNIVAHVMVGSVADVNPTQLPAPDVLWASPPCQAHSVARSKKSAPRADGDVGEYVIRFVAALLPRAVVIENVPPYQHAPVFKWIVAELFRLGYFVHFDILNAADFGVPQSRRRLILRAVRGGLVPQLPESVEWRGWYDAVKDLIPTFPESAFAPWQLARLPEELRETFVVNDINTIRDSVYRAKNNPCNTIPVIKRPSHMPRAFLLDGANGSHETLTVAHDGEPTFTIGSRNKQAWRAWLSQGRVVSLTPRALARLQTVPDWYELPERKALACKVIGNGVPCLMAQRILETLTQR